jgi:hypothetical protein
MLSVAGIYYMDDTVITEYEAVGTMKNGRGN